MDLYAAKRGGFGGSRGQKHNDTNFTSAEWQLLKDLKFVLESLSFAQEFLEGNKFVTSSLVLYLVPLVRDDLVAAAEAEDQDISPSVKNVATNMIEKMDEIFGDLSTFPEGSQAWCLQSPDWVQQGTLVCTFA